VADALGGAPNTGGFVTGGTRGAGTGAKMGEAIVWYLGHMGWAVRTANHFMVFDYDGRSVPPDEPSLANGSIDPAEIKDLSTTVSSRTVTPITTRPQRSTGRRRSRTSRTSPDQARGARGLRVHGTQRTKTLDGLDITTTMANDEGVGFFVKVDGLTIFHSGDHSAAGGESFKPEIDFLVGRGLRADLLFMPVSGPMTRR